MTLHQSIISIVKKSFPEADQASLESIADDINKLFDEKLKESAKHFTHQYIERMNRACEPGSEVYRRLHGELGDMEKSLIANLSSMG